MRPKTIDTTAIHADAVLSLKAYNVPKQFDLMTLADIERYIKIAYEHGYVAGVIAERYPQSETET